MTQPRTWRQPAKSTPRLVYGHCANPGCLCAVEAGERYCSDHCAAAAESVEAADATAGCSCGHPECA